MMIMRMVILFLIIQLLQTLHSVQFLYGASASSCPILFKKIFSGPQRVLADQSLQAFFYGKSYAFTDYAKAQKAALESEYKGGEQQGAQKNFEQLLEYILEGQKDLPTPKDWENLRDQVHHILESINYLPHEKLSHRLDDSYNSFHLREQIMTLSIPKDLRNTDIENLIKIHEIFHAIYFFKLKATTSLSDEHFMSRGQGIYQGWLIYLDEATAMTYEWNYASQIPTEIKESYLQIITNHPTLDEYNKKFIFDLFSSQHQTASGWVLAQHKKGHYDRRHFGLPVRKNKASDEEVKKADIKTLLKYLGGFSLLSGAGFLSQFCLEYKKNPPTEGERINIFLENLCF